MAPRTPKPKPKLKPAQAVRGNPGRVTKSVSSKLPSKRGKDSYRMKRYRDGLLNLEKTPPHLVDM